jgi:hypothetical protein
MRLTRIFNDQQAVLLSQSKNAVHVCHLPVEVHGDDGFHSPPRLFVHKLAVATVSKALVRKVSGKPVHVHIVGAFVDIHESRQSATLRDSLDCSDKGIRHRNDGIVVANSAGHQCKPQGIRAAAHANTVLNVAVPGERFFEILDHGPANKASRLQGTLENSH